MTDHQTLIGADWTWQPIETAPRDGTLILLLSAAYSHTDEFSGEQYHHEPRVNLGLWQPKWTSWQPDPKCPEKDTYVLLPTGCWESGGGWFEPDEVTHWMPLPNPPIRNASDGALQESVASHARKP